MIAYFQTILYYDPVVMIVYFQTTSNYNDDCLFSNDSVL